MAFTQLNTDLNNISALSDYPNDTDGLSAAQLKAIFDKAGNDIKNYINTVLLPELEAAAAAGKIGIQPIPGITGAMNIQAAVEKLQQELIDITVSSVADGSISTAKLADAAVTGGKIASGAVGTEKLADGSVTAGKIAAKAVSGDKMADGAVSSVQLADKAVAAAKLADGAVTTAKLAAKAVGTEQLDDVSVGTAQLKGSCVTKERLANGAVTADKLAAGSVTAVKIGYGSSLPASPAAGQLFLLRV